MSRPIVLRRAARAEFDEAADWYDRQRPGLGSEFVARVEEALGRIAVDPELHAPTYRDVRRIMVARFPYSILYLAEPTQVLVIAVFHGRRDPSVWQSRA